MAKINLYNLDNATLFSLALSEYDAEADEVHIHLSAINGLSPTNTMAACDMIRTITLPVYIHVYGIVDQAALLVMSSVDISKRVFHDGTMVYFSDSSGYISGTVDEADVAQDSYSEVLDNYYAQIRAALAISDMEMSEWMSDSKLLDRSDLLAFGFIDDIPVPVFLASKAIEATRTLYVSGDITEKTAERYARELHTLLAISNEPILTFVSSNGGDVSAMMAMMQHRDLSTAPMMVSMVGEVSSAAALFSATFKPGTRTITKNSVLMFHLPRGSWHIGHNSGKARVSQEFGAYMKAFQEKHVCAFSGKSVEEVRDLLRVEHFISAEKAVAFGAADKVY